MTTLRSLSRSATDRDAVRRREPGLLETLAEDPRTHLVLVDERGRVCLDGSSQDFKGTSEGRGRREPGDADQEVWRPQPQHGPRLAPLCAGDLDLTALQTCYLGREDRVPQDRVPQDREPGPGDAEGVPAHTFWLAVLLPASLTASPPGVGAGDVVDGSEAPSAHEALRAVLERYPLSALRAVGSDLSARDAGLATAAVALAAWHARAPYCPSCGTRTQVVEAGWARRCPGCASLGFPRTDPAVIMSVTDDTDRLVLVHGATWEEHRFSVVAGFVEAGECAEAAVVREVLEEVGMRVESVESVATQPWPFPRSLMLAYRARLAPGEHLARPDGSEVSDAVVLSREELAAAVASGEVLLPGPTSIARFLVEDWYGGPVAG